VQTTYESNFIPPALKDCPFLLRTILPRWRAVFRRQPHNDFACRLGSGPQRWTPSIAFFSPSESPCIWASVLLKWWFIVPLGRLHFAVLRYLSKPSRGWLTFVQTKIFSPFPPTPPGLTQFFDFPPLGLAVPVEESSEVGRVLVCLRAVHFGPWSNLFSSLNFNPLP